MGDFTKCRHRRCAQDPLTVNPVSMLLGGEKKYKGDAALLVSPITLSLTKKEKEGKGKKAG